MGEEKGKTNLDSDMESTLPLPCEADGFSLFSASVARLDPNNGVVRSGNEDNPTWKGQFCKDQIQVASTDDANSI